MTGARIGEEKAASGQLQTQTHTCRMEHGTWWPVLAPDMKQSESRAKAGREREELPRRRSA
eukprot:1767352-Rhodomonas_salina.1